MKTQFHNIKFYPHLEYYWSLDSLNFSKLPQITAKDILKLKSVEGLFYGQHDRRIFPEEENSESSKALIERSKLH